jgi:hypothetical protein
MQSPPSTTLGDHAVHTRHGCPMLFALDGDRGIRQQNGHGMPMSLPFSLDGSKGIRQPGGLSHAATSATLDSQKIETHPERSLCSNYP